MYFWVHLPSPNRPIMNYCDLSVSPKIHRNHRTCWAWVGARLPFRNTYHNFRIHPFLGQPLYYAPDENSGFLGWVDHHPDGHIFTKPSQALSPPPTWPIPHSLRLSCFYVLTHIFLNLTSLSPAFFRSLPSVSHVSTHGHFSHPQQRVVPTHKCTQISCFIPLQPPFPSACSTN